MLKKFYWSDNDFLLDDDVVEVDVWSESSTVVSKYGPLPSSRHNGWCDFVPLFSKAKVGT